MWTEITIICHHHCPIEFVVHIAMMACCVDGINDLCPYIIQVAIANEYMQILYYGNYVNDSSWSMYLLCKEIVK